VSVIVLLFMLDGQLISVVSDPIFSYSHALLALAVCLLPAATLYIAARILPKRMEPWLVKSSAPIEEWVQGASPGALRTGVMLMAGLTLFLELVLIRWQVSYFPVLALHKNFTLLACFCGLGLGYALARAKPLLLPACLPVLALALLMLMLVRYGSDHVMLYLLQAVPIQGQTPWANLNIHGVNFMSKLTFYLPTLMLLTGTFALNVLIMLPAGQFCGFLMEHAGKPLVSYGCNLLGSIAGIVALFVLSCLWIGPVVWFAVCAVLLLWYQLVSPGARGVGVVSAALCLVITSWPAEPLVDTIFSPYQIIQKTAKPDGYTWFLAAGSYRQEIVDLSMSNSARNLNPGFKNVGFFETPYRTAPSLDDVLIVGAGVGNDPAAALRAGAKDIDAVEIDPVIREIGLNEHSEHAYKDPRVHAIITDGRGYLTYTHKSYDAIVYGGQDTTLLLAHGSNVRLDTYVFTQEGLRAAFSHLKPGGFLSTGFVLGDNTPLIGKKMYRMLKDLPGAGTPVVVAIVNSIPGGSHTLFMVRKGAEMNLSMPFLTSHGMSVVTDKYAGAPGEALQLPTDDWPFFYMDERSYPVSYMASLLLVLLLSAVMVRRMLPGQQWAASLLPFFFLGVGFMLVETKAITELGLVFGNTWQVIGITITSVLAMAYLANVWMEKRSVQSLMPAFSCLLLVIAAGYGVATHGGISYGNAALKLGAVILLTSPLFFSGIIFSTLLKHTDDITGAMAYNLMGAMLGGLLEYNSLRFGFAFLYLIALLFYGLAWFTSGWKNSLSVKRAT
jgi:hypothetical protein